MNDLHLVASVSAAGSLRIANRGPSLSGDTFCVIDDLSLGPLSDGYKRADFWRKLTSDASEPAPEISQPSYAEYGFSTSDAFAPWRHLLKRLKQHPPRRVLIWVSASGADYVMLRMACHWLASTNASLWQVKVPARQGYHSVAVNPPEALVIFAPAALPITTLKAKALADEFEDIASRPEPLREVDAQNRLSFKPISVHDALILESCPQQWTLAARVIGEAMGRCDPRNGLGDVFLASRLRHLIDTGVVEADYADRPIRHYNVRKKALP